jgi:hypothetical protein
MSQGNTGARQNYDQNQRKLLHVTVDSHGGLLAFR